MIISKRVHLNRQESEQPLLAFIDEACLLNEADLTKMLNANLKWERPRGDLITWVKLLNHFDELFEKKISLYGLDATNPKLAVMSSEDTNVIVACLNFTNMLLEHCLNRNIYGSSDRIYQLILTPTIDVRLAAMEVAVRLGERYINSTHLKKYCAPKDTRQLVLDIARSFPPPVPTGFLQKQLSKGGHSDGLQPHSEHYSLVDTLDPKKAYPSKWGTLNFTYYSSSSATAYSNSASNDKREKKHSKKAIQPEKEGLVCYTLCENTIKKLSLEQIFDKASEVLPESARFRFSLAASSAKAFSTRSQDSLSLREKLLRLKCAAVSFTSYMCSAEFTSSNLFEAEPYLINFLVDFISPDNLKIGSNEAALSALKALESISQRRQWGGELIRNLGGNVTHGVLYQQLRVINRQIREESDDCVERKNLLLFTIIGHFIENKSMIPRLSSGGILPELMTFLNIKTKYRWSCSAAVNTIASLLRSCPEYISDFIRLEGFRLLIETIEYEVDFAIEYPDFAGGAPDDPSVHYRITLRQVNYLRNLFRLCSQLLQADGSDRMRNLFDTSILATLKKVIQRPDLFGPPVVGASLDVVLYIIHNEPTAFAILNEAGVVDSVLNNYASLFMPSVEIQISLLEVLGAISLNKDGLKRVQSSGVLSTYFQSFYDFKIARELVQGDVSTSIGVSMDELGRHFPDLKPLILAEVKQLVKNMYKKANQYLKPIRFYGVDEGSAFYTYQDSSAEEGQEVGDEIESWETAEGSTLIDNLFGFLIGLLQESGNWFKEFTEGIPFSDWLPYIALERAPIDYMTSNGMTNLMNLLKFLEDEKPDYGLPSLIKLLPDFLASSRVQSFINSSSSDPFLMHESSDPDHASGLLIELNAINNILLILCESYLLPTNMVNEKYLSLINNLQDNEYPILQDLIKLMGRSVIEEAAIRLPLSPEAVEYTAPVLDAHDDIPPVQIFGRKPRAEAANVTWADARFKNALQIRFLAYRFQHNIALILSDVAKSCMQKRQDFFTYDWRRGAVRQTKELATQLEKLFDRENSLSPEVAWNYRLVATNLVAFISRGKDKGREVISTALFLCFFHHTELLRKLRQRAVEAFNELLQAPIEGKGGSPDTDYISNTQTSIKSSFLIEALTILIKATDPKFLPKLPFTHLFFNKKYCPNENAIVEGLLTEASTEAMEIIRQTIGTKSSFYRSKSCEQYEILSLKILLHLIDLMSQIWIIKPVSEFYMLDENRGTPSFDQIQHIMQELQLPQHRAVKLLKSVKNAEAAEPEIEDEDTEFTPEHRQKIANLDLDKLTEYEPIQSQSASRFEQMRTEEGEFLLGRPIIELSANIDHLDKHIALFIQEQGISVSSVIMDYIEGLSGKSDDHSSKCKANSLNLLRRLFMKEVSSEESKNWEVWREAFVRFLDIFITESNGVPNATSKNYLKASLMFLEPIISKTPPNTLPGVFPFFDNLDTELKRKLFNILMQSNPSEDLGLSLAICKMLYLYACVGDYKAKVASSQPLKKIFCEIRDDASNYSDDLKELQKVAILTARACFEDLTILGQNFSSEIVKSFKRQPTGVKDFRRLLDENAELLSRDPSTFIDVASRLVRLENYDGKIHHPENLFLIDYGTPAPVSGDVEMKDSEKADEVESGGLMHFLLLELMACSKEDWISSPGTPEGTTLPKENQLNVLMRNSKFAYLCFLLQTITELLGSYKQAKLEFITFSKKEGADDRKRPRSTSLNFFIHQLNATKSMTADSGLEVQKREAISSLSKLCLLALVSTPTLQDDMAPDPKLEDADLAIVRRLVMDIIFKVIKDSLAIRTSVAHSYQKLYDVFDLCSCLLSNRFREMCFPLLSKAATKLDQFFIASAFIERQLANQITNAIADIDLNYPDVTKLVKVGIKPLSHLARIKLTFGAYFESNHQEKDEEEVLSDDIGDETPDLFRNSTLGMYDANSESDEEFYDEGEPLEVVMSGSEISQDDEDDDEGESSDMDDDDENMDEDERDEDDMDHVRFEGYDSDASDGDIEIIDELDIGSHSDDSNTDGSDVSEFYGFEGDDFEGDDLVEDIGEEDEDDEEDLEYDEEELNGWLDTFGHQDDSDDEPNNTPRFGTMYSIEDQEEDSAIDIGSGDDDNDDSEGTFESEIEELGGGESNSAAREFVTSIFQVLRPALRQQNVSNIFEGLVNGRLRNTFHVSGNRGDDGMLPGFDRAFEVMLNNKSHSAQKTSLNHFYIRSAVERWRDAHVLFYSSGEPKLIEQVRSEIRKRIQDESFEIYRKLNDEREKLRQQREEKAKHRREEARRKREEEERQREAERQLEPQDERQPVILRIGDRDVDISGTDIDPEFFEALPDDMREEVFTQHIRERRANANNTGTEVREIDPDFLEALPDQIREEILQQEAMARRFSGGRLGFLEVDEEDDSELEGNEEGEEERNGPLVMDNGATVYPPGRRARVEEPILKKRKTFSSPLVDKAGVASMARLLFIPQTFHQRTHIFYALSQLCNNKQTRSEVLSLLIAILNDGLHNQKSLEKMFVSVCARANNSKYVDESEKRVLPVNATPVVIGIQLIEAVFFLLDKNIHARYYLLTEHENVFVTRRSQRKKLQPSSSEDKFPINYLLKLLENPLLHEQHMFIDLLASVLQVGTRPLLLLKQKEKQHPPISTTSIPDRNLKLIVRILSSNECANTTFRRTISAMQNLSVMKSAQEVFSAELSDTATKLSHNVVRDLHLLSAEILSSSHSSSQSKLLSKFTAASSDQAKLLRILTALDYMYENRPAAVEKQDGRQDKASELTGLYERLELGKLWSALSSCLRALEKEATSVSIATALLPLIEALMVVCKHSKVKDLQIKDVMKYEEKKIDFTKEPIESLFFSFTDEHKKLLNQMVRTNPNLMSGPFSMLVRNPRVLEFDNKKNYFDRQLHEKSAEGQKLSISIRRDQVFLDSYRALFFKSIEEFRKARLEINFKGESGIDAGGVTREWYQVLSRQMFNPDYALFSAIASDETTFHPNRTSFVNPEHLSFFKFIGRIIGKAIYDGCFLDCHFSRAVYKKVLERPLSLKDMETLDLEYFKSLMWMLDNDITDIITEDFSVESDDYGEHKIIDLIPDGRNIPVTEENKHEYVRLVVEYRLQKSVEEQMNNFCIGFHEIIPKDLVAIFDEQELELLISGLPDIDVGDWQVNTTYNNYSPSSEQIQWFWRAVKSFDNEERAKLLQFATGTSKVPLNGFKELRGASGTCSFSIHRDYGSTDRLPSSHTCFNQIDLPAYETYETLRGSLLLAITEGHEGFGLA